MPAIIIHISDPKDLTFLQELVSKLGFKAELISESDNEDFIMAQAIEENDPSDQLNLEEAKIYYKGLDKSE